MITIRPEAPADFAAVREGLAACTVPGEDVVVVLGQPHHDPGFGLVPAATRSLTCEYPVPDDVFLVTEWVPGALRGRRGLVKYHPEFARV